MCRPRPCSACSPCRRRIAHCRRRQVLSGRCSRCPQSISRIDCSSKAGSATDSLCPCCTCRARPRSAHPGSPHRQGWPRAARPGGSRPAHLRPGPPAHRVESVLDPARVRPAQSHRPQVRRSQQAPGRPARPQPHPAGRGCRRPQGHHCRRRPGLHNASQRCTRTPVCTCPWVSTGSSLALGRKAPMSRAEAVP